MSERTLAIIKPDAVAKHAIGDIIRRYEEAGLFPIAMQMMRLSKGGAEGFYAVHRERPFFQSLVEYMSSGAIVAVVLEGDNAIARWRELMGATNPANAAEGTIRKDFALDVEQNTVHGSDAADTASLEIPYFFNTMEMQG